MAIIGGHTLLYSSEPEKLRAVLRDVFGFAHVDVGHGWLIFTAPPSEIAVHPADDDAGEGAGRHQLTFMCDDIVVTVRELRAKGIVIDGETKEERWGVHVTMQLPGGVPVMLYQPKHPTAIGGGV